MSKNALIILERPWGENISPNNRASVLPFFQGLQQLNGNFDLYHSHFYNKSSFELALQELMQKDYENFYVYVACHGKGRKLENMHLTSALSCINTQANSNNIVGVVIGACLVGENSSMFESFTEASSVVWKFGYKCSVDWLPGTLLDVQIFSNLIGLKKSTFDSRDKILKVFKKVLINYKAESSIGSDKNEKKIKISDSLTLVVQPKGQGFHAKECGGELFK